MLVWVVWFALGAYIFWFAFYAKTLQPLTYELVILWKLHKQQTRCNVPISKVQPLLHEKEFVVFRCGCGYKYSSNRLVTQKPRVDVSMHAYSAFSEKKERT